MLAGMQDELEGMTAVGGEHKDKGKGAWSLVLTQHVSDVSDIVPLYICTNSFYEEQSSWWS
jgi:hypothetical protein